MVFFLEDPLTGDAPHRNLIEEEDEQVAQEVAPQYAAQPEVQWTSGAALEEPTAVFLVGQPACLLSGAFFPQAQAVGSIAVPELVRVRSPLEEEYGSTHKPVHTCALKAVPSGSSSSSGSSSGDGLLLVECPRELPAEQAAAWARGVLRALRPCAVVVATTLPAMSYRGPGSPSDDDLIFSLRTAPAAAAAGSQAGASGPALPPPLPEATVLGGLPAALLTRCELTALSATLVVGVRQQQVPDAAALLRLGHAAVAALQAGSGAGEAAAAAAAAQPRAQLLAALGTAADGVYRASASSSIFI